MCSWGENAEREREEKKEKLFSKIKKLLPFTI
jgi:hypothetical protein